MTGVAAVMPSTNLTPTATGIVTIAALSLIPYILVVGLALIPLYLVQKKALLGAAWKDSLLWVGSVLLYFGASVGIMFVPWPADMVERQISVS